MQWRVPIGVIRGQPLASRFGSCLEAIRGRDKSRLACPLMLRAENSSSDHKCAIGLLRSNRAPWLYKFWRRVAFSQIDGREWPLNVHFSADHVGQVHRLSIGWRDIVCTEVKAVIV